MIGSIIFSLFLLGGLIFYTIRFIPNMMLYTISGGVFLSLLIIFIGLKSKKININRFFICSIGLIIGAIISILTFPILQEIFLPDGGKIFILIKAAYFLSLIYIFAYLFHKKYDELEIFKSIPGIVPKKDIISSDQGYKILDTSVIIDGRIVDISETGFLEGILIVPRFVLNELQRIADSADPLKRQRGRRGLDMLNKMKKGINSVVQIVNDDFPEIKEVDEKLIFLAKKYNGEILTNDYNLNKVAQLQGVKILNINELANAVKPVVLPGEKLTVMVIKEGKDHNQGIGYMEDGTMVVVEDGNKYIGKKIDVNVTSVLQTPAGRMIFAK